MNARSYKTVFSKRLGALVAVGEHATSQGKANGASGPGASAAGEGAVSSLAGIGYVAALSASFAFVSLAWAAPATNALPTGGTVVQGAASMSQTANQLNITQGSQRAAINWQSFDIGANAKVNVVQPNAQAVLLNRVVGQSPSQIFGQLQANGHVILVNPNGVLFGKDGSVNAGGFTASTLNISDANFMAGNMVYERNGSTAGIINEGKISTEPGGYVALLGTTVSNEGSITTQGGSVVMGAGETIKVPVSGTGRIKLELTPAAINASLSNTGSIVTEGGQVYMQALALNRAAAQILQSGSIDTTGEKGGDVHVLADGGHIRVSGSIKANSNNGTAGGDIYIGRDKETNVLAAVGDVSGASLETKGGFAETSGSFLKVDDISVKAKDWLLDPTNIRIVSTVPTTPTPSTSSGGTNTFQDTTAVAESQIQNTTIQTALNNGTNVTIATGLANSVGNSDGNIVVDATIVKSGTQSATLTLTANNGITVNQRIGKAAGDTTSTGQLNVNMTAHGGTGTSAKFVTPANSLGIVLNNVIDANGGTVNLTGTTTGNNNGVLFNNNSGITAGSFAVTGNNTSTSGGSWPNANGVRIGGNVNLTSTTANGSSLIRGSTLNTNGYGTFVSNGTVLNVNAQNGGSIAIDTAANSAVGMRMGFNNGLTVNTDGNVTLGSKNSDTSQLVFQATANANSGSLTLLGKSGSGTGVVLTEGLGVGARVIANNAANITIDGESGSGIGVMLGAGVTGTTVRSSTGAINITGKSNSVTGIYSQNNSTVSSTAGANITLTGSGDLGINLTNGSINTAGQVALNGASVNNVAFLNAASITGGSVVVDGQATGNGSGVSSSGSMTASTGPMRIIGRSAGSGAGVYSAGAVSATAGSVTIEGTSVTGGGVTVQGVVTAQTDVSITGTSSSTASTNQGVVIQQAVTANTGNITVTGNTNSNSQRAVAITANGTNNGSLQTAAAGKTININADTLLINTQSSVNAGTSGTVNIKTTSGNRIELGIDDNRKSTAADRVLGLDQGELNRITAGKTVIGDTASSGKITVAAVTATQSSTGNITLQTAGDILVDKALTVAVDKNLTLNGAGANSKVQQNAAIVATGLELLGANAEHKLTNTGNRVGTLAANTKKLDYTNSAALTVGTVNGSSGITSKEGASVTTQSGNLHLNESISNQTSGNVVVGAAVSEAAGSTALGDVKTTQGKGVTNTGGKLIVYSGSAAGTGNLSYLNSSLYSLVVNGTATQNADTNVAYNAGAGITGSTATAQVMFREKVTIANNGLVGATVNKTYGDTSTASGADSQLLAEAKTALKGANSGSYNISNNSGNNTIVIDKAVVIDSMTGSLSVPAYNSTSTYLKAATHNYGDLSTAKYTTQNIAAGDVKVAVGQRPLAGSITPGNTTYGEALVAGAVNLTNKVVGDVVDANGVSFTTTGLTSTSGNLKAGTHTDVQRISGLIGADRNNYTFADVKGSYTVDQKSITTAQIAASGNTYGGTVAAGGVTLGSDKITADFVSAAATIDGANAAANLSNSGNLKAGRYGQTVATNALTGLDAGNYKLDSAVTAANSYTVAQKALVIGGLTANDKVYNGDALAAVNTAGVTKAGLVGADVLTLTNVSGTFRNDANTADDKNVKLVAGVAAAKTVALKSTYGGADRDNYLITDQVTTSAVIAQRALTIDVGTVSNKTIDGTTTATVTPGALNNLVAGESLGVLAVANFSDPNVGTAKVVTASYTLQNGTNGLASNYILNAAAPNPDSRLRGNIVSSVNPIVNPSPLPVNNNTGSRVSTVSGSGSSGAATGVLDDQPLNQAQEVCSDLTPENCECQASVIPSIEICFAPKSVAATKEEK